MNGTLFSKVQCLHIDLNLRQSKGLLSDEGLTLETSAL